MGQVYQARDTRLGRPVAIKILAKRFSERFEREARAISALNHPHMCTLHDVGPNYLVMELVERETLADRLRQGPLPMKVLLRNGAETADALAAAHSKGIMHRDLNARQHHADQVRREGARLRLGQDGYGAGRVVDGQPRHYGHACLSSRVRSAIVSAKQAPARVRLSGTETVLVVEDQADVRKLAVAMLRTYRYIVIEAATPEEALSIIVQRAASIDVVVTDIVMPGLSGPDLIENIKASRPNLAVVFMSGYTEDTSLLSGIISGDAVYLPKPFTAEQLAAKVREALARVKS
jgi:CheY-like chemotaxis protein